VNSGELWVSFIALSSLLSLSSSEIVLSEDSNISWQECVQSTSLWVGVTAIVSVSEELTGEESVGLEGEPY